MEELQREMPTKGFDNIILTHLLTHSLTYKITHSSTHLSTHSLTHSLPYLLIVGGTEEFDLGWTCHKKDLCVDVILSGAHSTYKMSILFTIISIVTSGTHSLT